MIWVSDKFRESEAMGNLEAPVVSLEYFQDVNSVEADWLKLVSLGAARHIFLTPHWARAWWPNLGGGELRLLEVAEEGQLRGLIPLITRNSITTLLGDKDCCDYLDILALPGKERKVAEVLLNDFKNRAGTLDLFPLRPDSILWQYLPTLVEKHGYILETEAIDVSFSLELPSSWEAYLQSLKRKDRHELRRKLRNLHAAGEVHFHSSIPTDKDMADFFFLFRASREDKRDFMTPQREAFFRRLARELGAEGWVHLSFLELDNKRVAAALCFDYRDSVSLYNSGYDPVYAPLSVGLLCKAMTVKEAIEKGRKTYDFLRGAEDYKFHLGGKPFSIYRAVVSK